MKPTMRVQQSRTPCSAPASSFVAAVLAAFALGAVSGPLRAQTDQAQVVAVIDAFHAALARGDSATALAQLAPDVTVLESGGVETLEDYRTGHLVADMRYAQAVSRERGEVSVTVVGDVAWAHSTSVTQGRMGDREVNSQGAELMVLSRRDGRWSIRAIHWSSRQRRGG